MGDGKEKDDFLPDSLLDVREARQPSPPLSRLMLVAASDNAEAAAVERALAECVQAASQQYEGTGIGLLQQSSLLVLAELHHGAVERFLLALQERCPAAGVGAFRVAAAVEDCPFRVYSTWMFQELSPPITGESEVDKDDWVPAATAPYQNLLQAGDLLREHSDFAEFKRRYSHLLPSADKVRNLARHPDMMTLSEYASVHFGTPDVVLDSELVWPAPTFLDIDPPVPTRQS